MTQQHRPQLKYQQHQFQQDQHLKIIKIHQDINKLIRQVINIILLEIHQDQHLKDINKLIRQVINIILLEIHQVKYIHQDKQLKDNIIKYKILKLNYKFLIFFLKK